ncbi:MAG TPA: 30S ribosome-binding factor RbfA [Gammaproteobacteria bacterium]|nr:30S ribosome-binding factor RbfA [Gammaproteobacteria bacterium]
MAKGFKREQRINDLIQTTLAEIIQREATDLHLGMITLTGVNVSHDLASAKIFVSVLEEDNASRVLVALNNAAKFLRYELANAVELRVTPELKFIYDDSSVRGSRITSLINNALKKNNSQ